MRNAPQPEAERDRTRVILVLADRLLARGAQLDLVRRHADRDAFAATMSVAGSPRTLSATLTKGTSTGIRLALSVGPFAMIPAGQAPRLMSRLNSRHGLLLVVQDRAGCLVRFFGRAREWLQPGAAEEVLARLEEVACALTSGPRSSAPRQINPHQLDLASGWSASGMRSGREDARTPQLALSFDSASPSGGTRNRPTLGDPPRFKNSLAREVVGPSRRAGAPVDGTDVHPKFQASRGLAMLEARLRVRGGSEVNVVTRKLKNRLPVGGTVIFAGGRRFLGASFGYADSSVHLWIKLSASASIDEPKSFQLQQLLVHARCRMTITWSGFDGSVHASMPTRDFLAPEAAEEIIARLEAITCVLDPSPRGASHVEEPSQLGLHLGFVVVGADAPQRSNADSQLSLPLLASLRQ